MLLACIAVCMSNMSFSLHGFSVHVPCQTLCFSQASSVLPQNDLWKGLDPPLPAPSGPYFKLSLLHLFRLLPFFLSFSVIFFFFEVPLNSPFLLLLFEQNIFERCFLYSVPLSLRKAQGPGLSHPVGERGTARGWQYTNTKQYPVVQPCLFSTMGSSQHQGHPVILRFRAVF